MMGVRGRINECLRDYSLILVQEISQLKKKKILPSQLSLMLLKKFFVVIYVTSV